MPSYASRYPNQVHDEHERELDRIERQLADALERARVAGHLDDRPARSADFGEGRERIGPSPVYAELERLLGGDGS